MTLPHDTATLLAAIRMAAVELALDAWPELGGIVSRVLPETIDPFVLLPVVTARASGGSPHEVTIAAAILLQALALTILDDVADDDERDALHRRIGVGRAVHIAGALQIVGLQAVSRLRSAGDGAHPIVAAWMDAAIAVYEGQDREQTGEITNLASYRRVVERKTVAAFRFAALAGALSAGAEGSVLEACVRCGTHIGWMVQLLDDLEAFWFPGDRPELARGLRTFPVWIGLELGGDELRTLVLCESPAQHISRIRELLDSAQVRPQMVRLAADERDRALASVASADPAGAAILTAWTAWAFRDWKRLAGEG